MFLPPKMTATVIVGQCRPLLNKDKAAWAYSIQMIAMGLTLEANTRDENVYKTVAAKMGQPINVTCGLELYNGQIKLQFQDFTMATVGAPAVEPPAPQLKPSGNGAAVGSRA